MTSVILSIIPFSLMLERNGRDRSHIPSTRLSFSKSAVCFFALIFLMFINFHWTAGSFSTPSIPIEFHFGCPAFSETRNALSPRVNACLNETASATMAPRVKLQVKREYSAVAFGRLEDPYTRGLGFLVALNRRRQVLRTARGTIQPANSRSYFRNSMKSRSAIFGLPERKFAHTFSIKNRE